MAHRDGEVNEAVVDLTTEGSRDDPIDLSESDR